MTGLSRDHALQLFGELFVNSHRGGQLGYVVIGWATGAIVELTKSYYTAPKGNEIASGGGMVILALIGTTLSAIGASNPAKPKPAIETTWRLYALFRWSVKLSLVAFVGALWLTLHTEIKMESTLLPKILATITTAAALLAILPSCGR